MSEVWTMALAAVVWSAAGAHGSYGWLLDNMGDCKFDGGRPLMKAEVGLQLETINALMVSYNYRARLLVLLNVMKLLRTPTHCQVCN
ncbi:unnamed protein product [Linum tenue]|uniref:Uncharacterized protein n=1 Tax=Linum tenue TaxID=586396 RepID=A0AAV0PXA1_9ROSI|nr:unnamed protein product [Linum tenue]